MIPVPLIAAALLIVGSAILILLATRKRGSRDVIPDATWILFVSLAGVTGHAGWIVGVEFAAAAEDSSLSDLIRSAVTAMFQPREAAHWLVILLTVLGAASLAMTRLKSDRPLVIILRGLIWWVLLAAALTRLLWGSVYLTRQWSMSESVMTIAAESLMLVAAIIPGLRRTDSRAAPGQFLLWTVAGVSSAIVIGLSGSAVYSQMAMFTCLIPMISVWFSWLTRRSVTSPHLPAGLIVSSIGLHLWLAHYFAELTLLNEILLNAALISAGWYGFLSHQSSEDSRTRWLRRLAVVSTISLAVGALGLAARAFSEAVSANPYY